MPLAPRLPQNTCKHRWHPDIPAVAEVSEGELFKVECVDWTGERETTPPINRPSGRVGVRPRGSRVGCTLGGLAHRAGQNSARGATEWLWPLGFLGNAYSVTTRAPFVEHSSLCLPGTGGQIEDNDCADDIKHVDLSQVSRFVVVWSVSTSMQKGACGRYLSIAV